LLLATGKANIEHPPRAFVDIAIRNVAGSIDFLKTGAPVAFVAVEDQQLKREFTASNDSAIAALSPSTSRACSSFASSVLCMRAAAARSGMVSRSQTEDRSKGADH